MTVSYHTLPKFWFSKQTYILSSPPSVCTQPTSVRGSSSQKMEQTSLPLYVFGFRDSPSSPLSPAVLCTLSQRESYLSWEISGQFWVPADCGGKKFEHIVTTLSSLCKQIKVVLKEEWRPTRERESVCLCVRKWSAEGMTSAFWYLAYFGSMLVLKALLFYFYNWNVPLEFLQSTVYAGCFSVSITHRTLTWTTGSLTCAQMLKHVIAHGVYGHI